MPKPLRALIVEDNELDATLLVRELRRSGYDLQFERVDTPDAMDSALSRQSWDIVLSDFTMPRFSAPAALSIVKERALDLPFIIISGTVGETAAVTSLRAGAHDFLVKGALARLQPAIERELREAALRADRKKMHEQLLISERMASVGTLAAGVAHEINNPLAILVGNLELISEHVREAESLAEIQEPLRDALEAAERVRLIVRDLKVFSRADDEERREPVDIHRVLESSIRMASNEIRHRARLTRDFGEVSLVEGNEARLGQVFLNLIVNAAQAIPEGRSETNEIKITTEADDVGHVIVAVQDTGAGIPRDVVSHIFDAFFTTKPAGIGTGLGLAICHRIVTAHGGDISVESQIGRGSVFRVALPSTAGNAGKAEPVRAAMIQEHKGRILVVDDEQVLCTTIRRVLGGAHDVTTVTAARDALRSIQGGERFDLILCDLMMPEMTGMDLYEELFRIAPDQVNKMIFMTGGAFTDNARQFLAQSSNPTLEKPFKAAKLREMVQNLLRQ